MLAELYPIAECPAGLLAIMPRPRAGDWLEDEILSWRRQGLGIVVSLLEDSEVAELGLEAEELRCQQAGMRFLRLPIADRDVPDSETVVCKLVIDLIDALESGQGVGVHCRIGVGRAALLSVCLLTAMGIQLELAWKAVEKARRLPVPDTPAQRLWVAKWLTGFQNSHSGSFEIG